MKRHECCCRTGQCRILYEQFNGNAGTDIGPNWNEVSGSWELDGAGNLLGSDAGVIVATAPNGWSKRGVASCIFTPTGPGPWVLRLFCGASSGAVGTWVQASLTETSCTLNAGNQSKVFDTTTANKPEGWIWPGAVGHSFGMTICYADGILHVSLTDIDPDDPGQTFSACIWEIWIDLTSGTNGHTGIEIVTGDYTFSEFRYNAHHHDDVLYADGDDEDCKDCTCTCGIFDEAGSGYPPWRIAVDFYNPLGPCACYDGNSLIFETLKCGALGAFPTPQWFICTTGSICGRDHGLTAVTPALIDCGGGYVSEEEWILTATVCNLALTNSTSITCKPLEILWNWSFVDLETECYDDCPGGTSDAFYALATDASNIP